MAALIIIQFLAGWLTRETTFMNCIVHPFIEWKNIFDGFLNWSAANWILCSSYWLQFSYIQTILWFPLLKGLCVSDKTMIYTRRFLMSLTIIEYFIRDISNFTAIPCTTYSVLPIIVLDVLIGYEIYNKIDKIRGNKKIRLLAGGVFLLGNIIRTWIQVLLYGIDETNGYFASWNRGISLLTAVAITLFILSFKIKCESICNIILDLGKNTFGIFLIHWAVLSRMYGTNIYNYIIKMTGINNESENFVGTLLYTILYALTIFIISFIVVKICRNIFNALKKKLLKIAIWRTVE